MKAAFKSMDEAFDSMDEAFDSMDETFDEVFASKSSSSSSYQSSGGIKITTKDGHVVIKGKILSLKVNGVNVEIKDA